MCKNDNKNLTRQTTKDNSETITVVCISIPFLMGIFLTWKYYNDDDDNGIVPKRDMMFMIAYPYYLCLANVICFDSNRAQLSKIGNDFNPFKEHSLGRGTFVNQPSFKRYIMVAQFIAVLLPLLLLVITSSSKAQEEKLKLTGLIPSLLTLVVQVISEMTTGKFHDVLRVLVPIGFNAYRLHGGPLLSWVNHAYSTLVESDYCYGAVFNFVIATMNIIFWTWNLYGFLLLRMLPLYFDKEITPPLKYSYTLLPIPSSSSSSNGNK